MVLTCSMPDTFIDYLSQQSRQVAKLSFKEQHGVAYIIWTSTLKQHRHEKHPEYLSFHCRALEELLGRQYKGTLKSLDLLDVKRPCSIQGGTTRAYQLSAPWEHQLLQYLLACRGTACQLVDISGRPTRLRQHAIHSKDARGNTAQSRARIPFAVRVNMEAIRAAITYLNGSAPLPAAYAGLIEKAAVPPQKLRLIQFQLQQLYVMANNSLFPFGMLPQEYVESASGRLYGVGLHLQSLCKEARRVALSGFGWDYDFENCHFSILAQLVERTGGTCPATRDYLANKQQHRRQIAAEIGISEQSAKQCLLMLLYGAKPSPYSAIAREIGVGKMAQLRQHPIFQGIYQEVQQAMELICTGAKRHRGMVINAMGKGIPEKSHTPSQCMAHLLQGYEAKMLNIVAERYGQCLLLLQHDGFAASIEIDEAWIVREIEVQTRIKMRLEKKNL